MSHISKAVIEGKNVVGEIYLYKVTTLIINNPVLVQDIVFRHVDPVQQQYQKLLWRCSLIA